jgi:tetratricopeptide (TPR) repeat protein
MNKRTIDDIAYIFKKAKEENKPKPIIFLGAGASQSAGIPLTGKIVEDILEKFKEKPSVKRLDENERKDYYKVMGSLSAEERRSLFYDYITDEKVKINVTHIYLAQLLKEGYVDYILTTNFDDLLLRACGLFNFIPPVYDVSILNDFTTTTFLEKSVTYLHGQHHGQWLLNAEGEMDKVKTAVPKIFERICNGRTWIIIGYRGEDEILDEIAKLGSFENELYWIGYEKEEPIEKVKTCLLEKERMNTYYVPKYNADSFFLKLHSEIGLHTPEIFNKPFSFLKEVINNIKDIEEQSNNDDLFKNVNERFITTKNWVDDSIENYENKESLEKFKQQIIEDTLKGNFDKAFNYLAKIKNSVFANANIELSNLFNHWGVSLKKDNLLSDAKEKYQNAIELNSENGWAYNNLANVILIIAINENNTYLVEESIERYKIASKLVPENDIILRNLGNAFYKLALKKGSVISYKNALGKFDHSIKLNPNNPVAFIGKGLTLFGLAKSANNDINLYKKSLLQFEIAISQDSENAAAYSDFSMVLLNYYRILPTKSKKGTLLSATKMAQKSFDLGGHSYNLSCCLAISKSKVKALDFLNKSLQNKKISVDHVLKDDDWRFYLEDTDFKKIIEEFKK